MLLVKEVRNRIYRLTIEGRDEKDDSNFFCIESLLDRRIYRSD